MTLSTDEGRRQLAHYLAQVNNGHVTYVPSSPIMSAGDRILRGLLSFSGGLVGTLLVCATLCALLILAAAIVR